jgi:hypothetical protein
MSATCPECQDGRCATCGGLAVDPGTGDAVVCECFVFAQELLESEGR